MFHSLLRNYLPSGVSVVRMPPSSIAHYQALLLIKHCTVSVPAKYKDQGDLYIVIFKIRIEYFYPVGYSMREELRHKYFR